MRLGLFTATVVLSLAGGGQLHASAAAGDTPPPEAEPVLELVAPIANPACNGVVVTVVLLPTVAGESAGEVAKAAGPVVGLCGAVPQPDATYSCQLDEGAKARLVEIAAVVSPAAATVVGVLPVRPVGIVADETVTVHDALPPPATTTGLPEAVEVLLNCKVPPPAPAPAAAAPEAPAPVPDAPLFADAELPLPTRPVELGAVPVPAPAQLAPQDVEAAVRVRTTTPTPGFAYPVLLALPLAVLGAGAYVGSALTRTVAHAQLTSG